MKKEQPSYYSIIPATVRYDKNLKANEKLLYGEITALANKNGCCWAANSYFADLYQVHKVTVSNWISNLEKQGYISVELEYIKGTKQVAKRHIYLNDNPTPINEKTNRYKGKDLQGGSEKTNTPINEKTKEELNNTSTNNTSTNTSRKYTFDDTQYELAELLWEKVKSNFPNNKEPNLESWANDLRLMMEQDKRTVSEIKGVINWSQNHEFWYANIQSARKLREKYETMYAQADREKKQGRPGVGKKESLPDWAKEENGPPVKEGDSGVSEKTKQGIDDQLARIRAMREEKNV